MKMLWDEVDESRASALVESAAQSVVLRDYQTEAVESIYGEWKSHRSTLLCLPTGTGKSVCFSEVMRRWEGGRILLIAHRKELIYQAVGHAKRAGLSSGIEMGSQRCSGREDVIVCSVQSLNAKTKCRLCRGEGCEGCEGTGKVRRMTGFQPYDFGLVTIDEAHHAVAKSYRTVLNWFGRNEELKTLLVTATPKRTDKIGLHNVCKSVAYEMQLREGIELGWLVPIRQKFVTVDGLDLSAVKTKMGDLPAGQVEHAFLGEDIDQERLLHAVAKPTLDEAAGRPTLVFAAGQEHARKLTAAFNSYPGVSAGCVIDSTSPEDRDKIVGDYKAGIVQVLVNCMVFTEGFDAPATAVIANARPTKSEPLYCQIIGRGTRPLAGVVDGPDTPELRKLAIANSEKPCCVVLDFVGNSGRHKLVSVVDVLAGGMVKSEDMDEAIKVAKDTGETVDIEELAEKIKQAREERAERAEQERIRRLTLSTYCTAADYTAVDVSLFGGSEFTARAGERMASKKQAGFAAWYCGVPYSDAKKMTSAKIQAIINQARKNAVSDFSTGMDTAKTPEDLRLIGLTLKERKHKDKLVTHDSVLKPLRKKYSERMTELNSPVHVQASG